MLNEAKINDLIAQDKKELSQFILDLCGFTLDEAGYHSEAYAFYLHTAFRRQSILQKEEWDRICAEVQDQPLGWWDKSQDLMEKVCQFAQTIVDEVHQANQDELPIKLLKTSYLNQLDKARKCSEQAARFINSTPEKGSESLSLSILVPEEIPDAATCSYTDALKAHVNYLDSLLALPFVLEKTCQIIARNQGSDANFVPHKTAEMLAQTLNLLQLSLKANKSPVFFGNEVIQVLKIALPYINPDVGLDDQSVEAVNEELLPFLKRLLNNYEQLERKKAKLSNLHSDSEDAAKASKLLLESLDVRFESLTEILCQTLLHPIEECNRALEVAGELSGNLQKLSQSSNRVDQFVNINKAFANSEQLIELCNRADQSILPTWLQQSNQYYKQLNDTGEQIASTAKGVLGSIGAFYNYSLSFIPKAISNYLTSADPLSQILQETGCKLTKQEAKKIMVYFAFYELIKNSGIQGPLESKFFAAYMQGIFQKDKNFNEGTVFDYEDYKRLEEQLDAKENLSQSLSERLHNKELDLTASLQVALDQNGLTTKALNIFLLIHRLNTLESRFNPENPVAIFNELEKAHEFESKEDEALAIFHKHFLYPALGRLFAKYKEENLIPLLENILDSKAEKHRGNIHLTRELYFKLKRKEVWSENDWNLFEAVRQEEEGNNVNQNTFNCVKRIANLAPATDSPDDNASRLTPKEIRRNEVRTTVETLTPFIEQILGCIQDQLDAQNTACRSLKRLTSNKNIIDLCDKKISYINGINESLNRFTEALYEAPMKLYITELLDNPGPIEFLANPELLQEKLENQITNLCTPSRLIRFAWHVLPAKVQHTTPISESFLGNLFDYYFSNNNLENMKEAEQAYSASLNKNPVPALMKTLNNPLALANLIPSQEKIMDVLVDKLLMESEKTITSWGVHYIKAAVVNITKENLTQLLPYPFLANLAIQALQSQAMQEQIAPMLNSLKVKYHGATEQISAQFKEAAKQKLYPLLGIEIQKTIAAGALSYVQNPAEATATQKNSFAMYYLQYRELKQRENQSSIVQFLFSELLSDNKTEPEKQSLIDNFVLAFATLDQQLQDLPSPADPLEKTEAQLQFLISNLDCSDSDNNLLIKLTLVNNLLLLAMDTAEELNDQDKIIQLQQQAIKQLSAALSKISQQKQDLQIDDSFIVLPQHQPQELYESLATANRRISKKQLERVKASLAQTKTSTDAQVKICQAMLDANAEIPLFNKSYAEWRYNTSKPARKVALLFSKLYEAFCFLFIWTAILGSILAGGGFLQTLFVSIGIAGAVGATATGTGAILVGALLLVRLAVKLTKEIWNRRREFQEIQEKPSLTERIGLTFLLSLKCLAMAVTKTLLTDYLVARLTTLLAFGPLASLRRAIRVWPSKVQVESEKSQLEILNQQLTALDELIDKQLQFLEKEAESSDQSEAIEEKLAVVKQELAKTQDCLGEVSFNDARHNRRYKERLAACHTNFKAVGDELELLKTLQQAQKNLPADEPGSLKPAVVQEKPVEEVHSERLIIKLGDYKQFQKALMQVQPAQQSGYLSQFWNWFRINKPSEPATGSDALAADRKSLRESSFFIIPPLEELKALDEKKFDDMMASFTIVDDEEVDSFLSSIDTTSQEQKSELDSSQDKQQTYFSSKSKRYPGIFQPVPQKVEELSEAQIIKEPSSPQLVSPLFG